MRTKEQYLKEMNNFGKKRTTVTLILSALIIPSTFAYANNAFPTFKEFIAAAIPLLLIIIPSAVGELLAYIPLMGTGSYIGYTTGNILSLRIASLINANSIAETEPETEEYEVITSMAIALSAIISISTISIGVLLSIPLKPIIMSKTVQTASSYILPALFGSMTIKSIFAKGGKEYITNKWMIGMVPFLIIFTYIQFTGALRAYLGIAIVLMLPVTLLTAKILHKKGVVKIEVKEKTQ